MGVVQKVLVLSVVFDDLWYAKMTFGESKKLNLLKQIIFWRKFGERSTIWLEHTWIFKKMKFM